jgi:flavodoxin
MKVLVTYFSKTGNTKKLAQAIYEGVEHSEKEIQSIKEAGDFGQYDLIFCGFPVHASSVPQKAADLLKKIPADCKTAIFATHGSLRGGQLAVTAFHHAASLVRGKVIGTFGCRGKVEDAVLEALLSKPEHKAWVEEAQSAFGHPDAADLEDGKDFARRMVIKSRSDQ